MPKRSLIYFLQNSTRTVFFFWKNKLDNLIAKQNIESVIQKKWYFLSSIKGAM